MEERRKYARHEDSIKSEIHDESGMTFSKVVDLSQGGIFISTVDPLGEGTDVRLMLYIPGQDPVEISGTVQWVREGDDESHRSGMGISFKETPPSVMERISKITR